MASYVDSTLLQRDGPLPRAGQPLVARPPDRPWRASARRGRGHRVSGLGYIRYRTTEFAVTDRRIIAKTGLISRNTVELFLDKVESLGVEQTVPGRILDFGTITIHGTGTTTEPFRSISAPLMLRKQFMQAADRYRQKVK